MRLLRGSVVAESPPSFANLVKRDSNIKGDISRTTWRVVSCVPCCGETQRVSSSSLTLEGGKVGCGLKEGLTPIQVTAPEAFCLTSMDQSLSGYGCVFPGDTCGPNGEDPAGGHLGLHTMELPRRPKRPQQKQSPSVQVLQKESSEAILNKNQM